MNLDKAKDFMTKAGYDPATVPSPGFTMVSTLSATITLGCFMLFIRKKNRKND